MRTIFHTIVFAVVTAMMVPVNFAQAADPSNGTWELNLAKSKFDPGPPLRARRGPMRSWMERSK